MKAAVILAIMVIWGIPVWYLTQDMNGWLKSIVVILFSIILGIVVLAYTALISGGDSDGEIHS